MLVSELNLLAKVQHLVTILDRTYTWVHHFNVWSFSKSDTHLEACNSTQELWKTEKSLTQASGVEHTGFSRQYVLPVLQ